MKDENERQLKDATEASQLSDNKYIKGSNKLDIHNWLSDLPETGLAPSIVEVRFKNTRKGFYRNIHDLRLEEGDLVAVEASPGHDIGHVSISGELIVEQMRRQRIHVKTEELKRVYRKAKQVDIQKWEEARALERQTMLESRKIARRLGLDMKIGDVEYQGDKTKAIFYYIADERVDFRELIKVLADTFHIRIEMRQIGARQEAGRIGGIGACGRELCCSTWISNFISVTTTSARYQDLSLNPQKLAGQCGKLKCCLNYEVDCYVDTQNSFPPKEIPLHTRQETFYFQKMEVFKGVFWYSTDPHVPANIIAVPVDRVREIQQMNKKGKKPQNLIRFAEVKIDKSEQTTRFHEEDLDRFNQKKPQKEQNQRPGSSRRKKRRNKYKNKNRNKNE